MDAEQHPYHSRLRAKAEHLVKEGRWTLRLTTHVALGGLGSVGIMSGRSGEAVVVRFWDHKADLARLAAGETDFEPTVHERQYGANAEQCRALLRQLAALPVPVLPEAGDLTVDGVLYEIHCERGQHSTTMQWVSTAPKGWETLGVWFTAAWSGLSHGIGGDAASA